VIRETAARVRTCPICGRRSETLLYSISSAEAVGDFAAGLEKPQYIEVQRSIERIWARQSCDFLLCEECTFGFADPFVAATPELYARLYSTTAPYAESKWEFERTLSAIGALVQSGKMDEFAMVDVGAGAGAFASRASDAFSGKTTILCTEYSECGLDLIRDRGLSCLRGGLMDIDTNEYAHRFDILSLFQVLEHMDDVDAVFGRLSALATDRAHLFIAVPNHQQRSYFDTLGFHEDRPPVHVARWNRRSLEIVAGRHGWKLEEDATQPQPFSSKVRRLAVQFYLADPGVERLGRVRQRSIRRALRAGLIALFLLRSPRAVLGLTSKNLGTAYWAHLSRG
jgi:Methyltransferase domain